MKIQELIRELREPNGSKIILLVADGLGGLPLEPGGKTELESGACRISMRVYAKGCAA